MFIQHEMEDESKFKAMKEEYKMIRERIKQKRETFAELKAEAIKILEDINNWWIISRWQCLEMKAAHRMSKPKFPPSLCRYNFNLQFSVLVYKDYQISRYFN